MSNYQIILFVLFGFCAVIVLWYLVRAILYMRSHPDEFGWPHLVVLLLMIGIQPVSADNNQPRFMIPTADIDDAGISGISLITPGNPYFTVYLWYRNTNYDNTYWKEAPVITTAIPSSSPACAVLMPSRRPLRPACGSATTVTISIIRFAPVAVSR